MAFRPLGKRILVRRAPQVEQTAGGIIIPDLYQDRPTEGEILAVGDEVEKVKIGDIVLFAKFAGSTIENQDEGDLIVIVEDNVLGVLD